jgi:hypothetical protein
MQLRSLALFLVAAAVGGLSPCAHAAELTAQDMQLLKSKMGYNYGSGNLHAATFRFDDGVKGLGTVVIADGVAEELRPPFVDQHEMELHEFYCEVPSVVLVRNIDSKGVLAPDKAMIFTVANFEVVDSMKLAAGIHAHDVVTTWSMGGDVTDAGERLRVQINDLPSFKPGQLYVLELGHDFADVTPIFSVNALFSVTGDDQRLHIHDHSVSNRSFERELRGGSRTYDQFRAAVLQAAALDACHQP